MKIFAFGFSPELTKIATELRPLTSHLTFDQVVSLVTKTEYNLVDRRGEDGFSIFHRDGRHGLDRRLSVVWEVSCSGQVLTYRSHVRALYYRGNDSRIAATMEDTLTYYLPSLGYIREIQHLLPEPVVFIPQEIRRDDGVSVMLTSEFKAEYKDLFLALYNIFKK